MREHLYNLITDRYKGPIVELVKCFLLVLSFIYGLAVRILIFWYRIKPYRLDCKVISVGNITLGGTGKTSLVEYIAQYLKQQGHKVAILSRGYKKLATRYLPAGEAGSLLATNYETMGDEPYMLFKKLGDIPVIVDADRIRGAKIAISDYGADTVILDDGFQQWKIKKDLDIVTIDATNPLGNRKLLPRGILREPLSSLKRADAIVLTKTNLNPDIVDIEDFLREINLGALLVESVHRAVSFSALAEFQQIFNIEALKGKRVILVSGIGDPDSFESLITSLGINIAQSFRFPDHHNYTQEDLDNVARVSKDKNIDTLITTEKDSVRLYELRVTSYELRVLMLCIELKITKNEQAFHHRLRRLYSP